MLAIALAVALAGDALLARLYVGAEKAGAAAVQALESFRAQVKVEGEAAEKKSKETEANDKKRKESADAENRATVSALNRTIGELRHQRDSATRAFLSKAPAGSKCPDEQTCFNAAEYRGAYGKLTADLRNLADEGTAVTVDLDSAKRWAQAP